MVYLDASSLRVESAGDSSVAHMKADMQTALQQNEALPNDIVKCRSEHEALDKELTAQISQWQSIAGNSDAALQSDLLRSTRECDLLRQQLAQYQETVQAKDAELMLAKQMLRQTEQILTGWEGTKARLIETKLRLQAAESAMFSAKCAADNTTEENAELRAQVKQHLAHAELARDSFTRQLAAAQNDSGVSGGSSLTQAEASQTVPVSTRAPPGARVPLLYHHVLTELVSRYHYLGIGSCG